MTLTGRSGAASLGRAFSGVRKTGQVSGTTFSVVKAGFVIGGSAGSGTLYFRGGTPRG
jgi:hypothetical protein